MTRRNSDSGGHSGNQFNVGIRPSLINAVLGADYATQRVRPKGSKRKTASSTFEDNVVLEVRRLREQADVKPKQIIETLRAAGHVVTRAQVYAWLQYHTRAHLVPKPGAEPYIKP